MPKVSVYLPDELYDRVRSQGLSMSSVTQSALERQITSVVNDAWIDRMATVGTRLRCVVDTTELMDEVRDEFGR